MTRQEFLALHPFPKDFAAEKRLDWFWTFDAKVSPETLWPVLADSSRLNRALGLAEMTFEDRGGVLWGTSRPAGIHHEWVEVPWNWVVGQWQEALRVYTRGFSKAVYAAVHLEPIATGTRVYVYFGAVPRGPIGAIALKVGFPSVEHGYRRVIDALAENPKARPAMLTVRLKTALAPDAEARLAGVHEALKKLDLDRACVDALVDWVRTGDELDLHRIQVRERARAWRLDEDQVLKVFLHATRLGLLELSWDAVCPHCRGATEGHQHLGQMKKEARCAACAIDFGTDTAESVEITFQVHPSVRQIVKRMFCSAEAGTKAHVQVQKLVPAGGRASLVAVLPAGRYRLRVHGEKRYEFLDVGAGATTLDLVNDSSTDRRYVLEVAQWNDLALRPGRLLSFAEFRDLFGEEYLSADVQLAIGEQTILFTDIVGSTAMYAQRGDPAAFVEVKKHFTDVFAIVAKHRGAVVKTIGDAAMAAFNDPLDAVKASKDIHDCFHPARVDLPTRLRISINTGPCIAVRLNTAIDYFGHTVNIAAKLQGLAEAWQTAISEAVFSAPGVAAWLKEQQAALEDVRFASKAINAPIAVKRWSVYPLTAPSPAS